MMAAQEFTEYCAALVASATYNVNRSKQSKFITPDVLMVRSQHRRRNNPPAATAAPRYALPGERPPSMRPGQSAIDRFDQYVTQTKGRVRRG
jgi:hypothetical protein